MSLTIEWSLVVITVTGLSWSLYQHVDYKVSIGVNTEWKSTNITCTSFISKPFLYKARITYCNSALLMKLKSIPFRGYSQNTGRAHTDIKKKKGKKVLFEVATRTASVLHL